jgi:Leucine-rich repeat (LRR) protein
MLILMIVVAIPLAWLGKSYIDFQREAEIIEQLQATGVEITATPNEDNFFEGNLFPAFALPSYHIELPRVASARQEELLDEVVKLKHVTGLVYAPDEDLRHLKDLKELEVLELEAKRLKSFSGIENCKELRTLYLRGGERVVSLEPLKGLSKLDYFYQHSPDDASKLNVSRDVLQTWKNLRQFEIKSCQAIDMTAFNGLQKLEHISVGHTNEVTGLKDFTDAPQLSYFRFLDCHDLETLDGFASMTNLEQIVLLNCLDLENVEGIAKLKKLVKLRLHVCRSLTDTSPFANIKSLRDVLISYSYRALPDVDFDSQRQHLREQLPNASVDIVHPSTVGN